MDHLNFIYKIYCFLMWTIFKVFIKFVTILLLLLMFCFFGPEASGILVSWSGIEPAPPSLEGKVLTTGPPGKPWSYILKGSPWLLWQRKLVKLLITSFFLSVFEDVLRDPLLLVDMRLLLCCCKGLDLSWGKAPGGYHCQGRREYNGTW